MLESLEEMKEFLNSYELPKLNLEDTKQAKQTQNKNQDWPSLVEKSLHTKIFQDWGGGSVFSHNFV